MLANMVMGKMEEIVVADEPVLLWENPKPATSFVSQTVEVDGVGYSGYIVKGRPNLVAASPVYSYVPIGGYSTLAGLDHNSGYRSIFNVTDTTIQFSEGRIFSGGSQNSNAIPLAIYGVKFVL